MKIEAVVFDFDGVIANSEPLHFRGFQEVLAQEGVNLTESDYYNRYLGFDDEGVFVAVGKDFQRDWQAARIAEMVRRKARRLEELEGDGSVLFPGAFAAIERLAARCPLAIASGALRAEIMRVLERERLFSFFVAIVAAEDVQQTKPAPEPYERAVARLRDAGTSGLIAGNCVAIEDSTWGLQSAKAAGLKTVGIAHTYVGESLTPADLVISHLDELTWDLLRSALE